MENRWAISPFSMTATPPPDWPPAPVADPPMPADSKYPWYRGYAAERPAAAVKSDTVAHLATPIFYDPQAIIGHFESGDRYFIGVGDVDLTDAPLNSLGFPIWAGTGNSHAAGRYQFEPATWAIYAAPLGITDFSPRSQDAVFAACFAARGFADWLPYDAPLAAAVQAAGGEGVFSLGATWLAQSGAPVPKPTPMPAPTPTPAPTPVPTPETIEVNVKDQAGRSGSASITLTGMAIGTIMSAGLGVMIAAAPSPPPIAEATAPIVNPVDMPSPVNRRFDFSGSTFRFDRSPEGILNLTPLGNGNGH